MLRAVADVTPSALVLPPRSRFRFPHVPRPSKPIKYGRITLFTKDMLFGAKDRTEEIINLIWDRDDYYLVAAGKDAPSKKKVVEVAGRYGVRLPADYVAHATGRWGSPYLEVREHLWPRHKEGDVGPFWSFLYGLYVYAYSEEAPDWMRIGPAADEFEKIGHKILPILKVIGDADIYCFDSGGAIQRWMHEGDLFEPFDGTFFDLLEYEFKELDGRRKRKKAERAAPDQHP